MEKVKNMKKCSCEWIKIFVEGEKANRIWKNRRATRATFNT